MSKISSTNIPKHSRKTQDMSGTCYEILTFLTERDKTRYSRVDAYCYLLNRAFYGYLANEDNGSKDNNNAIDGNNGMFQTSIMELAKVWNWQRSSVRRFIEGLEQIHHVRREQNGKYFTLHVLCAPMTLLPIHTWSEETWMMAADLLTKSIRTIKRPSLVDNADNFSATELEFLDCLYGQVYKSFLRHEQMEVDALEDSQGGGEEPMVTSPRYKNILFSFI